MAAVNPPQSLEQAVTHVSASAEVATLSRLRRFEKARTKPSSFFHVEAAKNAQASA
ncbi:hypothetical protein [Thiocystis violacea]|uniref:hypothetical protein n=1 Tax=Thiocystis violacea TaxID=13725 RepID=UPI0019072E69|nr:hypothetical protein [Thiocystis violacea]